MIMHSSCRICGKEFIAKNGQQRGNSSVPLYSTAFIIIVAFMAATLYPVPAVKSFFSSLAADISGVAHGNSTLQTHNSITTNFSSSTTVTTFRNICSSGHSW